MLQVHGLSKSYGTKRLFRDVSFCVNRGEFLAVYGANGVGKSTLLRILSGEEEADSGSVVLSPPSLEVGYLPQGYSGESELSVGGLLLNRRLEDASGVGGSERASIEAALKAWELEGIDPARPLASLSGGEQTRLGLARLFAQQPQAVLLDEPTNHLDMGGIERLEDWLRRFKGAVVLVTHDRALLASIATSVLEMTEDGGTRLFAGPYTSYLETKERELAHRRAAFGRQERDTKRIRDQIRRLKERARRTELATTNFHYRKKAARVARQAKVMERRLQRSLDSGERFEKPKREAKLRPDLSPGPRPGDDVLSVDNLGVTIEGLVVLRDVTFGLRFGERCALIGRNGSGKTTLLRAIAGDVAPSSGQVRLGAGVRVGLLEQTQTVPESGLNAIDVLRPLVVMEEGELRRLLHHYLFTEDDVFTPLSRLSYGQRARLSLARLVLQGVNLLLLDEPTNHLDIPSREAFEDALEEFTGTVLIVSHDRYFVESYAQRVLAMEDGRLRELF